MFQINIYGKMHSLEMFSFSAMILRNLISLLLLKPFAFKFRFTQQKNGNKTFICALIQHGDLRSLQITFCHWQMVISVHSPPFSNRKCKQLKVRQIKVVLTLMLVKKLHIQEKYSISREKFSRRLIQKQMQTTNLTEHFRPCASIHI